jgi:hypothetical protein
MGKTLSFNQPFAIIFLKITTEAKVKQLKIIIQTNDLSKHAA